MILRVLIVALIGLIASGITAQADVFAFKIRGLTVGRVSLQGTASNTRYNVTGQFRNSGVIGVFRQLSYKGSVAGRVKNNRLIPMQYREDVDTGRRSSTVVMAYDNGVPRVIDYTSLKEVGADSPAPATQGGTLDPLSAMFNLLRDVPRDRACSVDMAIFDGKRRMRIATWPDGTENGLPKCKGIYQRLLGFTADEVARHKEFNLTLHYKDAGNGNLNVSRVAFDSLYGVASVDRQ